MPRIVVFGDSYATAHNSFQEKTENCWTNIISKKYNSQIEYYSENGSSLDYTAVKFYEYLDSQYREDDIIIVVLTSMNRLPIVHKNFDPKWSAITKFAIESQEFASFMCNKNPYFSHYLEKISPYVDVWDSYFNPEVYKSLCFLLSKTIETLPNKKIILSAFPESDILISDHSITCKPSGFLKKITENEFIDNAPYWDGIGVPKPDSRVNHISEVNHNILAEYAYRFLEGDRSDINYSEYKVNFLDPIG